MRSQQICLLRTPDCVAVFSPTRHLFFFFFLVAICFREVSVEVIDAERAHQDQAAAAERREREERVAADIMQSLVDSTVDEQLSHIVQKEVE